jgi:hypothetical protein
MSKGGRKQKNGGKSDEDVPESYIVFSDNGKLNPRVKQLSIFQRIEKRSTDAKQK